MILLVTDANILIDLLKTDLIEQFFGLSYKQGHVLQYINNSNFN